MMRPVDRTEGADLRGILTGEARGSFIWFQRVHTRADEPYCLIDIHLREEVFERDAERFMTVPIILVLAERHPELIAAVRQRVTFSNADEVSARALGIALGAPVVEILRTLVDPDGGVIAHTYARYPGEYVRIDFAFALDRAPKSAQGEGLDAAAD